MLTRLGIGVAAELAAPKAARLDAARRAGLPVPEGVVIPDEARRAAAGDASALAPWLGAPEIRALDTVAVRSAFGAEDGAEGSRAGQFVTRLGVDATDTDALTAAVAAVWASAEDTDPRSAPQRRDVLVMRQVQAQRAGVAATERDHPDDRVESVAGLADALLAGTQPGERRELTKLVAGERADADLPAWAARLQRLLRAVRATLGEGDWDLEWADDGRTCWLVQVRPLTAPLVRAERLTVGNHAEILPQLPSRFTTTLIASTGRTLFAWYRRFDPTLPARRPLVVALGGRPFLNRSLLRDLLRHLGLPTALLRDAMGASADEPEVAARPLRLVAKSPVLARLGLRQLVVSRSAARRGRWLRRRAQQPAEGFAGTVARAQEVYAGLVTEMFALANAMSLPTALLRRAGVLAELSRRQETAVTRAATDLEPLRTLVAADPARTAAVQAGTVPDDPAFTAAWQAYLTTHGHRGAYESDLARPRWIEDPTPLLASLTQLPRTRHEPDPLSWRALALWPLWVPAARALAARERLRSDGMRAFLTLRLRLLALAEDAVADGRLPSVDDLWLLTVAEVAALDAGWSPGEAFLAVRRAERARQARYRFPAVVPRDADPEELTRDDAGSHRQAIVDGRTLVPGTVRGVAWVLDDAADAVPPATGGARLVLVARALEPGWAPVLARIDAVVAETGGDLSHGSIVVRELGLPAITDAPGATAAVATGDAVELCGGALRRLD